MRERISKNGLAKVRGRRAVLSFAIVLGLAFCPMSRAEQSVKLAWNPSTASGVAGYMIHYGNDGIHYNNALDVGANTSWTVTGLQEGETNFFMVTAYDGSHAESAPSNQTVYYVPRGDADGEQDQRAGDGGAEFSGRAGPHLRGSGVHGPAKLGDDLADNGVHKRLDQVTRIRRR